MKHILFFTALILINVIGQIHLYAQELLLVPSTPTSIYTPKESYTFTYKVCGLQPISNFQFKVTDCPNVYTITKVTKKTYHHSKPYYFQGRRYLVQATLELRVHFHQSGEWALLPVSASCTVLNAMPPHVLTLSVENYIHAMQHPGKIHGTTLPLSATVMPTPAIKNNLPLLFTSEDLPARIEADRNQKIAEAGVIGSLFFMITLVVIVVFIFQKNNHIQNPVHEYAQSYTQKNHAAKKLKSTLCLVKWESGFMPTFQPDIYRAAFDQFYLSPKNNQLLGFLKTNTQSGKALLSTAIKTHSNQAIFMVYEKNHRFQLEEYEVVYAPVQGKTLIQKALNLELCYIIALQPKNKRYVWLLSESAFLQLMSHRYFLENLYREFLIQKIITKDETKFFFITSKGELEQIHHHPIQQS